MCEYLKIQVFKYIKYYNDIINTESSLQTYATLPIIFEYAPFI